MKAQILGVLAGALLLAGCESTANTHWERIGYGPTLEYADAQCRIMAMGTQQGVIAWGSPEYVAGAQIGNAVGNAIREAEFMKNCMTMQGWKRVPNSPQRAQVAPSSPTPMQKALTEWGQASNRCTVNKDKAACARRDALEIKLKQMGAHI